MFLSLLTSLPRSVLQDMRNRNDDESMGGERIERRVAGWLAAVGLLAGAGLVIHFF